MQSIYNPGGADVEQDLVFLTRGPGLQYMLACFNY